MQKEKKDFNHQTNSNIDTNKPLVKDSILQVTKEELQKEICTFYCQELDRKESYLTKEDWEIIEILEEKLINLIAKEINSKQIKNDDELKEEIEKLGKPELSNILETKIVEEQLTTTQFYQRKTQAQYSPTYLKSDKKIFKKEAKPANVLPKELSTSKEDVLIHEKIKEKAVTISNIEEKPSLENKDLTSTTLKIKSEILLSPVTFDVPNRPKQERINRKSNFNTTAKNEEKTDELTHEEKNENEAVENDPKIPQKSLKTETLKEQASLENKPEYTSINLTSLENQIVKLEYMKNMDQEKTELEDKNYDFLLLQVNMLLKEIKVKQNLHLKPETKHKLMTQEEKLINMQNSIANNLANDLDKEEKLLQDNITEKELFLLEQELKNMHLEYQIALNNNLINTKQIKIIEKQLIKLRLQKICKIIEVPSTILLPFIRNRYFFMFAASLFINNHLHLLNATLMHKKERSQPKELEHIKKGSIALEEALNLTTANISYLNNLEQNILSKYPELSLDQECLSYINKLKYSLIQTEEKILKKKKIIEKYNLKYKFKTRKLKKKVA